MTIPLQGLYINIDTYICKDGLWLLFFIRNRRSGSKQKELATTFQASHPRENVNLHHLSMQVCCISEARAREKQSVTSCTKLPTRNNIEIYLTLSRVHACPKLSVTLQRFGLLYTCYQLSVQINMNASDFKIPPRFTVCHMQSITRIPDWYRVWLSRTGAITAPSAADTNTTG